ncbi:MAG: hypothetical protein J5I92_10770 [Thiogranum sp.]|nr:hypothetical protein [Thiogranum sp.]
MSRYRSSSRYRSHNRRSYGHERALEHIRAAEQLSRELGGTDEDVKNYFFSLDSHQLKHILDRYEAQYGKEARAYAEITLPKWKNGNVHMSGMVAERLFNLLPPTMPLEAKFRLTESLWKHAGPSSNKTYYIGLDANPDQVAQIVKAHLEDVVIRYQIPSAMEARFNWLAQGDVNVKQQLLNHFRQQEKALLSEALRVKLPVLLGHLRSENGQLTTHAAEILTVGKHVVNVTCHAKVSGVTDIAPAMPSEAIDLNWIWWIIGIVVLLFVLSG